MKKRNIYWVVPGGMPTALHKKKISALQKSQISVWIVEDFSRLFKKFAEKRSSTVIIGDEFAESLLWEGLDKIATHPEFVGVRLVLSLSRENLALVNKAMQLGFRDIIPLDLDTGIWLSRFRFASLDQEKSLALPSPQMTLHNISGIHLPFRLTWVGKKNLRLECRIKLSKGSKLRCRGGLADYLGARWITLTVIAHHKTNLLYRYSDAYTCQWEVSQELKDKKSQVLDAMNNLSSEAPFKVFLAISNQTIRSELLKHLEKLHLEINVALQQKNIAFEPKFFNPDIVFLEDKFCAEKFEPIITKMLENTGERTFIYILGKNAKAPECLALEKKFPNPFLFLEKFPPHLDEIIGKKLELKSKDSKKGEIHYIPRNHPLSYGNLAISARLIKVHPQGVQLAVPFQILNYALITIDSPFIKSILNRIIAGKITGSHQHNLPELANFPFTIDCHLSDLLSQDRHRVGSSILEVFAGHLQVPAPSSKDKELADLELSDDQITEITISDHLPIDKEHPDIDIERVELPRQVLKTESKNQGLLASISAALKKYQRDIKILIVAILAISAFYLIIFKYRAPVSEQGRIYSEQLLKFQQRFQKEED